MPVYDVRYVSCRCGVALKRILKVMALSGMLPAALRMRCIAALTAPAAGAAAMLTVVSVSLAVSNAPRDFSGFDWQVHPAGHRADGCIQYSSS